MIGVNQTPSETAEPFAGRLSLERLVRADDARLAAFFAAYDGAFVLEDEKETLAGFQACLSLNTGAAFERLARAYAPYRESILLLKDAETGEVAGGANFIAFAHTGERETALTIALSYIFIAPKWRGRGHFAKLVQAVGDEAIGSFHWPAGRAPEDVLIFIEMNDPVRMDADDYARDSAHAGLDQIDRLRIWHRLGARLVDFSYAQPPLSEAQAPNDALLLGVLGVRAETLPACTLLAHLRCFFAVTVLKGADPMQAEGAREQITALKAACVRGESVSLSPIDAFAAGAAAARAQL